MDIQRTLIFANVFLREKWIVVWRLFRKYGFGRFNHGPPRALERSVQADAIIDLTEEVEQRVVKPIVHEM